jgi:glycosyltransferase involved in cell wall biosynthesis
MLGARQHYALAAGLEHHGLLARLYTDLYAGDKPWVSRLLAAWPGPLRPDAIDRYLSRRQDALSPSKVVSFDWFGIQYLWRVRCARSTAELEDVYMTAAAGFNARVIGHGLDGADVVIVWNGAGVEVARHAKARGVRVIVEQAIAPAAMARRLLQIEAERWPGWQPGLEFGADQALQRREEEEWRLADRVIAGSRFVREALIGEGALAAKCCVVPYGVPLQGFLPRLRRRSGGPLRLLFAGSFGLRKGAPYFLEALRLLQGAPIEAACAGTVELVPRVLGRYRNLVSFHGAVPRPRMLELYAWADVLVLPSIVEGSALVTYEALASGVPVIVTPNSGAWIENGIEGFIVPSCDAEALSAAIERLTRDEALLEFCSANALAARRRIDLTTYGRRVAAIVQELAMGRDQG